jgi:hypothetical protein
MEEVQKPRVQLRLVLRRRERVLHRRFPKALEHLP